MSYSVANEKEILDQFASNMGYEQFSAAVEAQAETFPNLAYFLQHGVTEDVEEVSVELREFAAASTGDVQSVGVELDRLRRSGCCRDHRWCNRRVQMNFRFEIDRRPVALGGGCACWNKTPAGRTTLAEDYGVEESHLFCSSPRPPRRCQNCKTDS